MFELLVNLTPTPYSCSLERTRVPWLATVFRTAVTLCYDRPSRLSSRRTAARQGKYLEHAPAAATALWCSRQQGHLALRRARRETDRRTRPANSQSIVWTNGLATPSRKHRHPKQPRHKAVARELLEISTREAPERQRNRHLCETKAAQRDTKPHDQLPCSAASKLSSKLKWTTGRLRPYSSRNLAAELAGGWRFAIDRSRGSIWGNGRRGRLSNASSRRRRRQNTRATPTAAHASALVRVALRGDLLSLSARHSGAGICCCWSCVTGTTRVRLVGAGAGIHVLAKVNTALRARPSQSPAVCRCAIYTDITRHLLAQTARGGQRGTLIMHRGSGAAGCRRRPPRSGGKGFAHALPLSS